jgi:hypothetical protein
MIAAEYPPIGDWLGNAGVDERHRQQCLELAASAERQGDHAKAETFRAAAADWRASRDSEQRRMELRQMNRRAHRRY